MSKWKHEKSDSENMKLQSRNPTLQRVIHGLQFMNFPTTNSENPSSFSQSKQLNVLPKKYRR